MPLANAKALWTIGGLGGKHPAVGQEAQASREVQWEITNEKCRTTSR